MYSFKIKFLRNLLILLTICLSACYVPKSIIRLQPQTDNITWNFGQEVVKIDQNGVEIALNYARHTDKNLIFDVEITNNSNLPILVAPEKFYYEPLNTNKQYIPNIAGKIKALDPEKELLNLDIQQSIQVARAKNTAITVGVLLAAVVVAGVIAETNNRGVRTDNRFFNNRSYSYNRPFYPGWGYVALNTSNNNPPASVVQAVNEREQWEKVSLRKHTLEPGYQIRGKVLFPRVDQAQILRLHLPLEDLFYQFEFKQNVIQPSTSTPTK